MLTKSKKNKKSHFCQRLHSLTDLNNLSKEKLKNTHRHAVCLNEGADRIDLSKQMSWKKKYRIEISRRYKVCLAEHYRAITLLQMCTAALTDRKREREELPLSQ